VRHLKNPARLIHRVWMDKGDHRPRTPHPFIIKRSVNVLHHDICPPLSKIEFERRRGQALHSKQSFPALKKSKGNPVCFSEGFLFKNPMRPYLVSLLFNCRFTNHHPPRRQFLSRSPSCKSESVSPINCLALHHRGQSWGSSLRLSIDVHQSETDLAILFSQFPSFRFAHPLYFSGQTIFNLRVN